MSILYDVPTTRKQFSYNYPNSLKQVRPNSSYHFNLSPERKTSNNFYREYNMTPTNFIIDYPTNISTNSHRNSSKIIDNYPKKNTTNVNWNKIKANINSTNNQINVNKRPSSSFSSRGQNQNMNNMNYYKNNQNQNNMYKGYYDNNNNKRKTNYNSNINLKNPNNENFNNINFQNNNMNNKSNMNNNNSLNDKFLSPYYSPNNNDYLQKFQKSNFNFNTPDQNSLSNPTKYHYLPPKSKQNQNKKTLILDLDETLVHSSFKFFPFQADIYLNIQVKNKVHIVNVLKRPYVHDFLKKMSNFYEIVIFTASNAHYANPLLDQLDIGHNISYRLFREHCISMSGLYIKDLRRIGRDLKDTIILDNNPISYVVNKENGIPIKTWHFDKGDVELVKLIPLFEYLSKVDDVRNVIKKIVKGNEVDFREVSKLINGVGGKDDKIDKGNNNGNNGNINISIVNQQVSNVFVNEYKNNGNVNMNNNLIGNNLGNNNLNNGINNNLVNRNTPINNNLNESNKNIIINKNLPNNTKNLSSQNSINKNIPNNNNLNNKGIGITNIKNYNINNYPNFSPNKNSTSNLNLSSKQGKSFKQFNTSNQIIQNPNSLNISYANRQSIKNQVSNSPVYFFYNKNSNDIQPITLKTNSPSNINFIFNNDEYFDQQQKLKNINYLNQNIHLIDRNRNISSVDLGNYSMNNNYENNLNFSSSNVRFRTPMRNSMQNNTNYYYNNLLNGMKAK